MSYGSTAAIALIFTAAQQMKKAYDTNITNSTTSLPSNRTDLQSQVRVSSTGEFIDITPSFVRAENHFASRELRRSVSSTSQTEIINQYSQLLKSAMENSTDNRCTNLVDAVNQFTTQASMLLGDNSQATKQHFITHTQNLAKTISDAAHQVNDLRFQVDQDLSQHIRQANQVINELSTLNQSTSQNSQSAGSLHDQRDHLLNELSKYFEIRVSFDHNGRALVSSATDGKVIVGQGERRAQFNYAGLSSQDAVLRGETPQPITLHYAQNSHTRPRNAEIFNCQTNAGRIAGLIELRDQQLPRASQAVEALASAVTENINRIHNNGSPFSLPATLTSQQKVSLQDSTSWSGKIDLVVMDGNGGPTSRSDFRAVTLDLETLPSSDIKGRPSIKDIITELNALLSSDPSSKRLAMGEITQSTAGGDKQIDGQYLLNDVKMVTNSPIDQSGNFTFDLELDGNGYFGSNIEILEVRKIGTDNGEIAGSNLATAHLPHRFKLAKDCHQIRTNQPIMLTGASAEQIEIKIKVTAENGKCTEGVIHFKAPEPAQDLPINHRIIGKAISSPNFSNQDSFNAPPARAKLIDDQGIELNLNNPAARGYLVIETLNAKDGLVISGNSQDLGSPGNLATNRGFSHFFGFNNLLENDLASGVVSVKADIVSNVNKLSIGRIRLGPLGVTVKLADGTDTYCEVTAQGPRIGSNARETLQEFTSLQDAILNIPAYRSVAGALATLPSYAAMISSIISQQIHKAKTTNANAEVTLSHINKRLRDDVGIDLKKEHLKVAQWENLYSIAFYNLRIMRKLMEEFLRSI